MKRLVSVVLAFCLLMSMSLTVPPETNAAMRVSTLEYSYSQADLQELPSEPSFNYTFLPPSSKWQNLVSGEQPATMHADYELADNVVQVDESVTKSIADMGQLLSGSTIQKLEPNRIIEKGGYISRAVLDAAFEKADRKLENGAVVVDKGTGTAFKVVSSTVYTGIFDADPELKEMMQPLENTYSLTKPELHEVIKDFNLDQTVTLTRANINGFAPNIEKSIKDITPTLLSVGDEDKMFKTLTGDNLIELEFKDTPLQGRVGNSTINIKLSGGIAIDGVELTGRYSSMGGYEISMKLQQECYIVAELDAEVHEEIKVPILGIGIPFEVGEIYGGIYGIIGMDGTFKLGIEARETSACRMGIKGGTFLYVPTSFHPIFEPEPPKITGDCSMLGKINGYVKFGPILGIEIFGFDLVGAGVLLGSGVNVQSDGSMLDIELYASIDIYIELLDEYFSLVRERPTIYRKQQPDMHGYKVSFLETYVNPGRVGGLIEKEPAVSGGDYIPAEGLEYKIWTVPKSAVNTFDAAKRETILAADKNNTKKAIKDRVRTYPENSFAATNDEGEFIQKNAEICYGGDQVYLEFKGDETTFFVGPATPVLPFTNVTIIYADYFNDYITGKVDPVRLIKWESDRFGPASELEELSYYEGPIYISPFNDYGVDRDIIPTTNQPRNTHRDYVICGTARTETNKLGEFDTRNPYFKDGKSHNGGVIDVLSENILNKYISSDTPPGTIGVLASLDEHDMVNDITVYGIVPEAPEFQFTRTISLVEDSFNLIDDGDRIINQMSYDEYFWIANPAGTRTITADMFEYNIKGFSTQDYKGYYENPVKETRDTPITLTPVLDKDGNPTGTTMFAQRITVEWVWQAHPNPIKITSADNTQVTAGEASTFKVTADGFFPRFSLEGAPERVWIDEETGLLYIPYTLSTGIYNFTIHAKEGNVLLPIDAPDPKKGNDPSKPDKQTFTLTVADKSASPSPSLTPQPSSSSTPDPDMKTVPVIFIDEYNTYFTIDGSADLTVPFKATGSEPITWSLEAVSNHTVPKEITINASTGVVTVKKSLAAGDYFFAVKANNEAGTDKHECTLRVTSKSVISTPVTSSKPTPSPALKPSLEPTLFPTPKPSLKPTPYPTYNPTLKPTETPEPLIAPKIYGNTYFSMTRGTNDLQAMFTVTGSQPITISVKAQSATGAPADGLTIDAVTGVLTVSKDIAAGHYKVAVTASNSAGKDSIECSLEVKAAEVRTAPVFNNRRDGYSFKMSSADAGYSVQLNATGSAPITYYLEPLSARMGVPSEITINSGTGVLTVQGGIQAGSYSFIVKATNDVGSDTQLCTLEVPALIRPPVIRPTNLTNQGSNLKINEKALAIIPLAYSTKPGASQDLPAVLPKLGMFEKEPPPNRLTLRCDDPKDVYTYDRDLYNGAYFIRWDTHAVISITDVMVDTAVLDTYSDYTYYDVVSLGDEVKINDNSPVCDRYHYYDPASKDLALPLTEEQLAEIKANMKKMIDKEISEYKNGYKSVNQDFSAGGLRDRYRSFTVNPLDKSVTSLEYGSLLKEMNRKTDGAYSVELNMETGTVITGKYFTSLVKNPGSTLSFHQNGAGITFTGKDITAANDRDLINIGYTYAPHEKAMLESIGPGFESFTYGFQHHGALPGMATFTVTTTLAEGTKVNVYKFDAVSNQFTLIAGNVTVGEKGVVTYKNNTMSEYIITNRLLPNVEVSEAASRQGFKGRSNLWLAGLGLLALLLAGAAAYILLRKR